MKAPTLALNAGAPGGTSAERPGGWVLILKLVLETFLFLSAVPNPNQAVLSLRAGPSPGPQKSPGNFWH